LLNHFTWNTSNCSPIILYYIECLYINFVNNKYLYYIKHYISIIIILYYIICPEKKKNLLSLFLKIWQLF
jgi:hypothetical protein